MTSWHPKQKHGAAVVWIVLGVLLIAVISIVGWGIGVRNKMVTQDETVKASWSQIETVLQRRLDLIPNLVETVKGFAKQEQAVLIGVTEARAKVTGSGGNANQRMGAENELSGALSRLMVVVEKYPELKSDQNFLRLQDELAGTENRIAVERRRYNESVKEYNILVRKFPASMIAGMSGFTVRETFEAPAEARTAPKVSFQ